jgi:hypothetical protein
MGRFSNSRFNPKPGVLDFWHEFRKPNPYRWPILIASALPFGVLLYNLSGETHYATPERPTITYITTFDPARSDAEIMASNLENQEVKELRAASEAELAERKRELYKALGAVAGMDVDEIERRGAEARAAEEAAEQARLDTLMGRTSKPDAEAADGAPGPAVEGPER